MGSDDTLRCHATHVLPVGFFVVTLRRGGRVIYLESLERFTGLDLANVTLTYLLRPGPVTLGSPLPATPASISTAWWSSVARHPATLPVPVRHPYNSGRSGEVL